MVYSGCKIYGPYFRKDGRQHIVVIFPDKKRKTVSYPKYLMEKHLDRYLEENETVDHIDCDFTNNEISNLQVLDRAVHAALDAKRIVPQEHTCPWCNEDFILTGSQVRDAKHNRRKGKAGPFCSRSCAGKYSKSVQEGSVPLEVRETQTTEYTTLKTQRSLTEETE